MKLYLAKGTISIAVAIMLEEAGLEYEHVAMDFAGAAQTKPDYLAVNPKGRVPALAVQGGILTETGAILEYIGSLAPGFVPKDAVQAARMREVMYYLASTMHVNHAHKQRGHRWADLAASHDDMRSLVARNMAASCTYLEENVGFGPFVCGRDVTLADAYLYVVCTWLAGDGVAIADYPQLAAHHAAMGARASVLAVRAKGWL